MQAEALGAARSAVSVKKLKAGRCVRHAQLPGFRSRRRSGLAGDERHRELAKATAHYHTLGIVNGDGNDVQRKRREKKKTALPVCFW